MIFYNHIVALDGTQILTASLFVDGDVFHAAVVTPGAVDIQPSLFVDSSIFYTATVTNVYDLVASLFDDSDAFILIL